MTTLMLPLTNADREFLEAQAARSGHGDAIGFLRSLIGQERERAKRLELEESPLEALREPGTEMTPEDWEEIRQEGMRLIAEQDHQ